MESTQVEIKIYSDEIDPSEIIWIPVPIDGKFEDIAFVERNGRHISVRMRQIDA